MVMGMHNRSDTSQNGEYANCTFANFSCYVIILQKKKQPKGSHHLQKEEKAEVAWVEENFNYSQMGKKTFYNFNDYRIGIMLYRKYVRQIQISYSMN